MIIIALTGSIGMGKTTTAGLFEAQGVPVFDADACVHALYKEDTRLIAQIADAFPGAVKKDRVDRDVLAALLRKNPKAYKTLEALVHPLVQEKRAAWLSAQKKQGKKFVLLDIPLLFESGGKKTGADVIVVVSAPPACQRRRVLQRPGMSAEKFEAILARQMPDAEKRKRADFIIDTGNGIEIARAQVNKVIAALQARPGTV